MPYIDEAKIEAYAYDLPEKLIARYPSAQRGDSRLLVLHRTNKTIEHKQFHDFKDCLSAGDLLVLNNTRVMPARLYGLSAHGGKIEVLIERLCDDKNAHALLKSSVKIKAGDVIYLNSTANNKKDIALRVLARSTDNNALFELHLDNGHSFTEILKNFGSEPLPPYIKRDVISVDRQRYHTVFEKYDGACAAPTAGLHFSYEMLQALQDKGVVIGYITLHVGYGTFAPVRCKDLTEHPMHAEHYSVDADICSKIQQCQSVKGRVVAVGTTVVRALESAAALTNNALISPQQGQTRLLIYPGFRFKVVQCLLTNFHQPYTTLLPLVAAFVGRRYLMSAYKQAVDKQYRFLSYGDAMFINN